MSIGNWQFQIAQTVRTYTIAGNVIQEESSPGITTDDNGNDSASLWLVASLEEDSY